MKVTRIDRQTCTTLRAEIDAAVAAAATAALSELSREVSMSAYVVEKSTIDVIVTYCFSPKPGYGPQIAVREQICGSDATPDALGERLCDLNHAAVNTRYADDLTRVTKGAQEFYEHERTHATLPAVYKALTCLLYQCSEGDCPDSPVFKALERLKAAVAEEIISAMPEYTAAPWG